MKKWLYMVLLSTLLFVVVAFSAGADVGDNRVWEWEFNDDFDIANPLYDDDTVEGVAGGLADVDCFEFRMMTTGQFHFVCSASHQNLVCILTDAAGNPLVLAVETDSNGVSMDVMSVKLPAGTYYLLLGNIDMDIHNSYMFYFSCAEAWKRPHEHMHVLDEVWATCTERGYKKYVCSCGDSYIDTGSYTEPLGHNFTFTDCETPVKCSRCQVTKAQGHAYDADCDTTCKRCDHVRTAKAHTYQKTVTKATVAKNGKIVTHCSKCDHIKTTATVYRPYSVKLSASSVTYNGSVRTPSVTVKDYAGKTLVKGTDYTVSYAAGRKNVGTYDVTVKFIKNITGSKTVSFKIKPISIAKCSITASDFTYTGQSKAPTITVKNANGTKLSNGTHYTVSRVTGCKNVGTHQVLVKMKGNYSGSKTVSFKIKPISIAKCSIAVSNFTYTGQSKVPTVTVKNANGTKLSNGTHYTVSRVTGCKNVGTHQVLVKMKGNYSGSKTVSFKINPPKTTVTHMELGGKKLTVHLVKKSAQVSGYQVQHATNSSFKNATTVTKAGYKNTAVKVGVSGSSGTYHLRVRTYRTVDGVKYYSAWTTYEYTV